MSATQVQWLAAAKTGEVATLDRLAEADPSLLAFQGAGTPDQVFEQIKAFWEYSGGFGHMLLMGQAGFLSDEDALKSMRLYKSEVEPRLKELVANADPAEMWEKSKAMPVKEGADLGNFGVDFVR